MGSTELGRRWVALVWFRPYGLKFLVSDKVIMWCKKIRGSGIKVVIDWVGWGIAKDIVGGQGGWGKNQ